MRGNELLLKAIKWKIKGTIRRGRRKIKDDLKNRCYGDLKDAEEEGKH